MKIPMQHKVTIWSFLKNKLIAVRIFGDPHVAFQNFFDKGIITENVTDIV